MCTAWSDEEYRKERICDEADYHEQVGRFYTGKLWRDDLLPVPRYLSLVVEAHRELDARLGTTRFSDNLLQHTFLGDGTRLDSFLEKENATSKTLQ